MRQKVVLECNWWISRWMISCRPLVRMVVGMARPRGVGVLAGAVRARKREEGARKGRVGGENTIEVYLAMMNLSSQLRMRNMRAYLV